MNCKDHILRYMREAGEQPSGEGEFTARELTHRIGKDIHGDGPEYNLSTVRRALTDLFFEGKVSRRLVGGHFLWRTHV
jgi:hypothetical protein